MGKSPTRNADSPAKKTSKAAQVVTKKGRKSTVNKSGKIVVDKTNYDGISEMLATPKNAKKTPTKATPKSVKKSSEKRYPKNLSHVETHKRMSVGSPIVVPLTPQNKLLNRVKGTPKSAKGKRASFHATPSKEFLSQSLSLPGTPSNFDATDFKFDAVQTPSIPVKMHVS